MGVTFGKIFHFSQYGSNIPFKRNIIVANLTKFIGIQGLAELRFNSD